MQKLTTTIILTIFFAINIANAQEFYVKKFIQDTKDISARTSPKKDANNQDCALIKIYTNLTGLEFNCTYGFCSDIDYNGKGEYKLYVSPGEQMIKIMKEKYMPMEYVLDLNIKALNTYKLYLTHKGFAPEEETTKSDFVKIYSTPSGADVYINGELKGTTPYEQPVPEGSYLYLIRKDKYHDAEGDLDVVPGNTPEVNAKLKPKFGKIIVSSTPSGADISINNKPTGKRTPATFDFQDPGTYNIMLQKYKYQAAYKTISLAEAKTENLNLTLTPDYAGISVKSTPENGANIELDGKPLNQTTPYTIAELSSGEHIIRLTKKMFKPIEKNITVTAGQNQSLNLIMQPTFAELTINAEPSTAKIYIDGTYKATGSYTGRQNEGLHIIELKKDKYKSRKENITITAGTPLTKTYKLKARKGNIAITTSPTKAEIYLNGTKKGTSPLMLYDLIIGNYTVEARKTGYAPTTQSIIISEGQTTNTKLTLQNGLTVTINSRPQGASLYINGSYKGKCPQTLDLSFGEHTVKLTGIAKYKETTHKINIRQGGKTSYTLTLNSKVPEGMVFVKGGTFQMGSNGSDAWDSEKPVHTVTVSSFHIGKYEVTQAQWKAVMGNNPSRFKGDNRPVEQVSWYDVQKFIKKLNQMTGKHYRLPTEAEWKYAARGGNKSRGYTYAGSNSIGSVAWYDGNSGSKTHPVGGKKPNELGLYDMSGNVWEWTEDKWHSNYSGAPTDGSAWTSGNSSRRVYCGGGWSGTARNGRSSVRCSSPPVSSYYFMGFRLCR